MCVISSFELDKISAELCNAVEEDRLKEDCVDQKEELPDAVEIHIDLSGDSVYEEESDDNSDASDSEVDDYNDSYDDYDDYYDD